MLARPRAALEFARPPRSKAAAPEADANVPLLAIRGLKVTGRSTSEVALAWEPITGAVSYSLERSSNGVDFDPLGVDPASGALGYGVGAPGRS